MSYLDDMKQNDENLKRYKRNLLHFDNERKQQQTNKKLKKRKLKYDDFRLPKELGDIVCRDITKFKAKSHNKDKQLKEFISYTYFKYEAPNFLLHMMKNSKMFDIDKNDIIAENNLSFRFYLKRKIIGDINGIDILKTVATGKSMSKLFKNILIKKEVHFILNSKRYELKEAILEGKMKYLNFNEKQIDVILETRITDDIFSEKTKYFLNYIKKYDINYKIIKELIDYTYMVEFNNLKDFFSKNLKNMLNDSDIWHVEQIFINNNKKTQWEISFEHYEIEFKKVIEKDKENKDIINFDIYTIDEILNAKGLSIEGKKMKHCVSSYVNSCSNGYSSILSMKLNEKSIITIEINKNSNSIVQAKGFGNREINNKEYEVLKSFSNENNLKIGKYL